MPNRHQGWYKPPMDPALVFDFEAMKAIEGVSKQNPNSVEGYARSSHLPSAVSNSDLLQTQEHHLR